MTFLTKPGSVLDVIGKIVTGVVLVWLLLTMVNLGFGGLTLINSIVTALIGQGVLGYYGIAAGVTMLALTGSKVWDMLEFSITRVREDEVVSALGSITGRGLRRGIPAFVEILAGGVAWPITALGWLGLRAEKRDREQLAAVREYHALRREIDRARPISERTPDDGGVDADRDDAPLQERNGTGPEVR